MTFTVGDILSIFMATVSLLGLFATYVTKLAKMEAMLAEMKELPIRVAALETKMGLFWRIVEDKVTHQLIAPHSLHRDDLLRRMAAHTLTRVEAQELHDDLDSNGTDFSPDKQLAVVLIIARLEQILVGVA